MLSNNPQTASPVSIQSLENLEPGCQTLYKELNQAHTVLDHRINILQKNNKSLIGKTNNLFSRLYVRLLLAESPTGGKREKQELTDIENTLLFRLMEKLDTPESKTTLKALRSHSRTINPAFQKGTVPVQTFMNMRHNMQRETAQRIEDGADIFQDRQTVVITFGQILNDDSNEFLTAEIRKEMIKMQLLTLESNTAMMHNQNALDNIIDSIRPLDTLLADLKKTLALFKESNSAKKAIEVAKEALISAKSEPQSTDNGLDKKLSSIDKEIDKYRKELEILKQSIKDADAVIKAYFAENPRFISSITAILKEIKMLCGDLVKSEINEITAWEISIAQRQWPVLKTHLPSKSPLSAIDPNSIEASLAFLIDHDDFLKVYHTARISRLKAEELIKTINDLNAAREETPNSMNIQQIPDRDFNRYEKDLDDANQNLNRIHDKLIDCLKRFTAENETQLNPSKPISDDMWAIIRKNSCNILIETTNKNLDQIESDLKNQHYKIDQYFEETKIMSA